jgi:hypothetical protein
MAPGSSAALAAELDDLDIPTYIRTPHWSDALRIVALDFRWGVAWDKALISWLPHAAADEHFADHMLFYVHGAARLHRDARKAWVALCTAHPLRSASSSILEPLVYRLGTGLVGVRALLEHALRAAATDSSIARALRSVGLHDVNYASPSCCLAWKCYS